MNKYFRIALAIVISALLGLAIGWADNRLTYDWDLNGTNEFAIDDSGNVATTGSITATGTGASNINGIVTVSGWAVDPYTETLPTSGFAAGSIIYYSGTAYTPSGPHFYASTATVTGVSCWLPIRLSND